MQEVPAARVAPVRLIEPLPEAAVMVPLPQEPVRPLGEAIARPVGSVSVKRTPDRVITPDTAGRTRGSELVLGLVTVNDRVVEPPAGIEDAPKAALMMGAE